MAKKKEVKKEEVVEEAKSVIIESSEIVEPDVIEVELAVVEAPVDITVAKTESTPTVVEEIKEIEYKAYPDDELVMFRNNKGHLKWGKYKPISSLGYLAIGTYAEYKAGKEF